jgi:hypothetical protein
MRSTLVESVTLAVDGDAVPVLLFWRGVRYTVSDVPTRLEDLVLGLTHLPCVAGWRFQGTSPAGDSRVFDVRRTPGGDEWELVRSYQ